MLAPTIDENKTTLIATGGFSKVYEATLDGRCVALKSLMIDAETIGGAHKVRGLLPPTSKKQFTFSSKLLVKEVVGWKWLRHGNILPFVGVSLKPPIFSIISERMKNGSVVNFIKAHPNHNRLCLVSEQRASNPWMH